MATHLYQMQGGPSPEGLLTVIEGKLGPQPALAVLKLEKEQGVRVRHEMKSGKATLSISHIRDLMLTEKTKVFKVGLFGLQSGNVRGLVADKQKSYGTTVAQFFLERFLGCHLASAPEVTTRQFFEETQGFINDSVADPERKARYQVALAAELSSQGSTVSLQTFANSSLEVEDRQPLMNRLREKGLDAPSFQKDVSLIEVHLRRIQFTFESGIAVLTPPNEIGETVKLDLLQDGRTRMQIQDNLKSTQGRR